ncbi:hypothetical protein [Clostridium pasteurianum]|uniref:Uncharacterized protein n=1 Tax=Clostridium pasteurianum BC1 TaxID=86416 RepID=R4K3L6_CLOPA|nr:hypothetical protein [Clostridium pasteurianum]AGK96316.1 hypothetical protein Clopa_1331 [Clostridium pasteurianum BC1]
MSRHSRNHHHKIISSQDNNNGNSINKNSGGSFNFGNIAQLLSNIDINQVSSLLGKVNNSQTDNNQIGEAVSNINTINQGNGARNTGREEIIRAINTLVNSDKSELLRIVMEIYGASKTKAK